MPDEIVKLTFPMLLEERRESGQKLIIAKWKLRGERYDGLTKQTWQDWVKKHFPAGYTNSAKNMLVARHWGHIQKAVADGIVTNFTELYKFLTKRKGKKV